MLFKIYGQVVVPPAVNRELQRESTPRAVRQWMAQPPHWLRVQQPRLPADAALDRLGEGEREAITLAEELHADAILIDERDGRRFAERRHLTVIGTLQIIDTAAEQAMIDFPATLTQLQKTNFRISARLLQLFLDRDAERQEKKQKP